MKNKPEGTKIESVIRRDRLIISIALASLAAVAWVYILDLATTMAGTDLTAMDTIKAAAVPNMMPWDLRGLILMFIMWAVMMVAMMTPSTAPMVLQFASIYRKRQNQHSSIVGVITFFVFGYFVVWTLFSAFATLAEWWLHSAALLSPEMVVKSRMGGGVLLMAAGVFQWTGLKHRCLNNCRSPIGFFLNEWREGHGGAIAMGIRHGGYCVGCCSLLMATLFVAGVMNVLWVGSLAAVVLIERLSAAGPIIARTAGGAILAWGAWMIFTGL